ncbi:glycine cleavage system aminomethyltransferase GcvT [Alicyclobacillus sp.]|uniref:glycine cleavage system aminomethyltransferase GcvT n=1 Tax=Alicyclobacillus sp. TaxID=61169 RepID=UPI0025C2AB63|nr:glycine cleavage system aminomethyltransferase GcvT [Alicyclobacillus sp.]MCL6516179.1 glycine cleavage system aminomethyltransferase GcvT [Alicyclobacillus sp.]
MAELKRTPLHPLYQAYGAKTVEFSGWEMPVQFSGILREHEAVRTAAGLFDVSHMGEFEIDGPDAVRLLQWVVTNDVDRLDIGSALYSPMTNEHGGCVDDLLVYRLGPERFWVVVNAGNIDKDYRWISQWRDKLGLSAEVRDRSAEIALLALQGPRSERILQGLTDAALGTLRYYRFLEGRVLGKPVVISRTGYTGEDGFELYAAAEDAQALWQGILSHGSSEGLIPAGLGARDTLRLEARLPLYGHELTDEITPLEAGLGMFVKWDKGPFVGRERLLEQKEKGVSRRIAGLQVTDRAIPRAGYPVHADGRPVGYVTSGTQSPTLKVPIALALLEADAAAVGTPLTVDVRGRAASAVVVKTPFYKRGVSQARDGQPGRMGN